MMRTFLAIAALGLVSAQVDFETLKQSVTSSSTFQQKVVESCKQKDLVHDGNDENCHKTASARLFCELLQRSKPDLAAAHCGGAASLAQVQSKKQRLRNALKALNDFDPKEDLSQTIRKAFAP